MDSVSDTQRQENAPVQKYPEDHLQTEKKRGSLKYQLYVFSAILVAVSLGVLLFVLLRPSSPSASSRTNETSNRELIYAQIIFRHGARAGAGEGKEFDSFFPRGGGEITDRGYNHSHLLGKFLKKRYVDSGFLNAGMHSKEMYWRSRDIPRCLSTASTVGAAMFQTEKRKNVHVAIVSNHKKVDELVNIAKCPKKEKLLTDLCPAYGTAVKGDKYTEVYKCLGRNHPIFQRYSLADCDMYINAFKNGFPVPDDIKDNMKAIDAEYLAVRNFMNGIGNPQVTKLRFGPFMDTLLNDLQVAWDGHLKKKMGMKRFKAYSTQDWVLSGILEGFGVYDYLLKSGPKIEPNYNSMIVMELLKVEGKAVVKFYFKPEEVTLPDHEMRDLTVRVPNCKSADCPLEEFMVCCNRVRTTVKKRNAECATV